MSSGAYRIGLRLIAAMCLCVAIGAAGGMVLSAIQEYQWRDQRRQWEIEQIRQSLYHYVELPGTTALRANHWSDISEQLRVLAKQHPRIAALGVVDRISGLVTACVGETGLIPIGELSRWSQRANLEHPVTTTQGADLWMIPWPGHDVSSSYLGVICYRSVSWQEIVSEYAGGIAVWMAVMLALGWLACWWLVSRPLRKMIRAWLQELPEGEALVQGQSLPLESTLWEWRPIAVRMNQLLSVVTHLRYQQQESEKMFAQAQKQFHLSRQNQLRTLDQRDHQHYMMMSQIEWMMERIREGFVLTDPAGRVELTNHKASTWLHLDGTHRPLLAQMEMVRTISQLAKEPSGTQRSGSFQIKRPFGKGVRVFEFDALGLGRKGQVAEQVAVVIREASLVHNTVTVEAWKSVLERLLPHLDRDLSGVSTVPVARYRELVVLARLWKAAYLSSAEHDPPVLFPGGVMSALQSTQRVCGDQWRVVGEETDWQYPVFVGSELIQAWLEGLGWFLATRCGMLDIELSAEYVEHEGTLTLTAAQGHEQAGEYLRQLCYGTPEETSDPLGGILITEARQMQFHLDYPDIRMFRLVLRIPLRMTSVDPAASAVSASSATQGEESGESVEKSSIGEAKRDIYDWRSLVKTYLGS